MRKLALAALAVAFVFLGPHPAKACGDKLLAMTRSIGLFKAYVPWKSASILIYQGHAGSLLRDKQFQSSLKAAGHKIEIVDSESQIDPKLSTGKYDLVLVEMDEGFVSTDLLGVKLDDSLALASSDGGRTTARVVGIFRTGITPVDYTRGYMLLNNAQTLLN